MQELGIRVLFEGRNFIRLLEELLITIRISIVAVVLSLVLGIILGVLMNTRWKVIRLVGKVYLEFIRIMPQLVLLFLMYFGLSKHFGINWSGEMVTVVVFTFWGTAEISDLVRGALSSIPRHQYESGEAIGLTKVQVLWYVVIPQTVRRLLPQSMNLITRMIKTTSLAVLIGVVEVLKIGQQIIESSRLTVPSAAIWIYGTIFFLYFIICYPISLCSKRLEIRWKEE